MKQKTVYILGAGFSAGTGAPSQEKLVSKIFEIHKKDNRAFKSGSVDKFRNFLEHSLLIPRKIHDQVPLEDIFTPLDRCLMDNVSFRNLSVDEIKEIRGLVYYLIGKTLEILLRHVKKDYVNDFANYLVENCSTRSKRRYSKTDPVSVISTNWDILLDNSLKSATHSFEMKNNIKGVVDYCCHISSYNKYDDSVKPGLEILGMGGYNVKLLKLHGSLNWLQCPRCLRLYVDFDNKIAVNQYQYREKCRHCQANFENSDSHILTSNLIMPTFLKNLTNPQYKIIWQNAGIELSEATKIVFIGYSLPQADFEMRQLLSRMIRHNAEIEVVDYGRKNSLRIKETEKRYRVFFGDRSLTFHTKGVVKYLKNILN
jgi:hypothetical protein